MCLDGLQQLHYININQRACADGTGLWIQMKRNVFLPKTRKTLEKSKVWAKTWIAVYVFKLKLVKLKKVRISFALCVI